jgi:putative phage-type endonuclease
MPADRLAWLLARQRGVGSSDAPNLCGVGYQDAASVYRSKVTAPNATLPVSGVLARGVALEPLVAQRYAEEMDAELVPCAQVAHPERPWQLANPDRRRLDSGRHVELKTVTGFSDEWGPALTDRIPDGYAVQVQHQMGVLGAESIDLAALDVIAWELRVYRIPFDPSFYGWLTQVEERFWREHVPRRGPRPEREGQAGRTRAGRGRVDRAAEGTRPDPGRGGRGVPPARVATGSHDGRRGAGDRRAVRGQADADPGR